MTTLKGSFWEPPSTSFAYKLDKYTLCQHVETSNKQPDKRSNKIQSGKLDIDLVVVTPVTASSNLFDFSSTVEILFTIV